MDLFGRKARAELSVTKAMLVEKDSFLSGAAILLTQRDKRIRELELKLVKAYNPKPSPTISSQPLYMSEDEEDLKYMLDHNLIDTTTYGQMLKELEFENAEVSLAVEDLPESFHY